MDFKPIYDVQLIANCQQIIMLICVSLATYIASTIYAKFVMIIVAVCATGHMFVSCGWIEALCKLCRKLITRYNNIMSNIMCTHVYI